MSNPVSRPELSLAGSADDFPRATPNPSAASSSPSSIITASAPRRRSRAVNSGDFFLAQQLRSPGVPPPPPPPPPERYCRPQTYIDLVRSWRCPPFRAAISQLGHYHRELPLLNSSLSSRYGSLRSSTRSCKAEAICRPR